MFDSEGAFVRTIGRKGQGPGELKSPCCLALGPGGRLWVRDGGNRRYQSYDLGVDPPKPVSTTRMVHFDGTFFAPLTFSPDGLLVDVGHYAEGGAELALWRFQVDSAGTVQTRVEISEPEPTELGTVVKDVPVSGGMSHYYFPQPYGASSLVAHGPSGLWATAVSSDYVVSLHRGDMPEEVIRGPSHEGPVLSAAEHSKAGERIAGYVKRGGGTARDYPPIPERKARLAALYFDAGGRLWVELSVEEGSAHQADVYDSGGHLIERREWPAEVSLRFPAWVGEGHALGVSTDSLGVQRVVRVRF